MLSDTNPARSRSWRAGAKRLTDIVVSAGGLLVLSPLMLYAAWRVRLSSPGPVVYSQERVGLGGKPFRIHKFRSMYLNAEAAGPQLSAHNDARVTPWGRTMRRWKADELPQLWNVLRGEMSLVGPRPERAFFIGQMEAQTHACHQLLQVKPGITSAGMVRFGYAGTVAEMIQRMQYDLAYVRNPSLRLDLVIMLQTLRIIFKAKGR